MGFFLTLFIQAAVTVLADLLIPKPKIEQEKPLGLGDFQFPTATEGRVLPIIWGRVKLKGPNVLWYGDLTQDAITEKIKTGLFSSKNIIKGYRYNIGIQFMLCQGPIDDLTRVWIGDDLVVDELSGTPITDGNTFTISDSELFGGDDFGNGGMEATAIVHAGSASQAVDTYLSPFQQEPTTLVTPAYHDVAYVSPSTESFYVGNSSSVKAWSFEVSRIPNGLSLAVPTINGGDANPMNVIYEILTSIDWGFGEATASIDTTNFSAVAAVLITEGNGFSFVLDRTEDIAETLKRVEGQIDGNIYINPLTGLWQCKLFRDDYTIGTVTALNSTNCKIRTYTQGTWEGTTNQVRVPFNDASDEYKEAFGFAQDMANVRILGVNISSTINHPGVKNAASANAIAWRELRTLSVPLSSGTFECDRSLFGVLPGDVLALTDEDLGVVQQPMRVRDVDYGEFLSGRIIINATQDIFRAATGSFAPPPNTGWEPPSDTLTAFPTANQVAFEAPRALTHRDPFTSNATTDKIWCGARLVGNEVVIDVRESHATPPTSPSSIFAASGTVTQFCFIGQLTAALTPGSSYPLTTLLLTASPDTQTTLEAEFPDIISLEELGQDLTTLCYIDTTDGGEFILVTSAQTSGGDVQLNNVFRGVLDSVQGTHALGANVFLMFVGGGLNDDSFTAGDNVDIKLLPQSILDTLDESSAVTIEIRPLNNRTRSPYPPSEFALNSVRYDDTLVDLGDVDSDEDDGVLIDAIRRRDHRISEGGDEVSVLGVDAEDASLGFTVSDFALTHQLVCFNGTTQLVAEAIGTAVTGTIRQLDILEALDATTLPASLTFGVRATHTFQSVSYDSFFDTTVTSTLVSDLIGKTAFGALNDSETSAAFTVVADSVDHVFTLSTVLSFAVQYNINGGAFTLLIAASSSSGTIANALLTNGDLIRIRHLDTNVGFQKLITMTVSSVAEAYGVLIP